MNTSPLELIVTAGPLKDRRFPVSAAGLRLGRSSSCEIAISDPALSRNHCLFELREEDSLWITDLASANGTFVNGEELGSDSRRLGLEGGPDRREVVVRDHEGVPCASSRDPRGGGYPEGGDPAPRPREQRVGMAMISPVELDEALAPGDAAGESDRSHRRLGTR